ncbi:aminotransferase class IV [Prochlorococcus marinus]|uniref:aminotransferase class IV n=1 Tax=Prochlorococcus marinus TaxID=1219 RepID=UPI0022B359E9|nr:aminotransferase class IV [Prochlorococcus marinus]
MSNISWLDGYWLSDSEVELPIRDRGVTLGDGIFETILILKGTPQLLTNHLQRWTKSSILLGMEPPPKEETLIPLINEAIIRASLSQKNGVLRLNWSRGSNQNRGINYLNKDHEAPNHRFWFELNEYNPSFTPISTKISCYERRNANSRLSQCKTFSYLQSIQARSESQLHGYDDALLLSTNGELSCGTTANIIILRRNQWLTPRMESGCLPGVMREQGLKKGIIKEAKISPTPKNDDQWILINSLSCHPITKVNNIDLKRYNNVEKLWRTLLIVNH